MVTFKRRPRPVNVTRSICGLTEVCASTYAASVHQGQCPRHRPHPQLSYSAAAQLPLYVAVAVVRHICAGQPIADALDEANAEIVRCSCEPSFSAAPRAAQTPK